MRPVPMFCCPYGLTHGRACPNAPDVSNNKTAWFYVGMKLILGGQGPAFEGRKRSARRGGCTVRDLRDTGAFITGACAVACGCREGSGRAFRRMKCVPVGQSVLPRQPGRNCLTWQGMKSSGIVVLCLAALATACASGQRLAPPDSATAPTGLAAGAPGGPESTVNRDLVKQGYRPSTFHGQLLYCRVERLTGSQFSHKTCLTEQEVRLQEQIAHDRLSTAHGQGKCLPPQCNN
jgi:hypothetical protein